jgi:hypothetical protein
MYILSNVDLIKERDHRKGGGVSRLLRQRVNARWFAKLVACRGWVATSRRARSSLLARPISRDDEQGEGIEKGAGRVATHVRKGTTTCNDGNGTDWFLGVMKNGIGQIRC